MGTVVKETVYVEKGGEDITAQIRARVVALEEQFLSRRKETAEIYHINSHAGETQGTAVSQTLWEICMELLEVSERSGGAFDFTSLPHYIALQGCCPHN